MGTGLDRLLYSLDLLSSFIITRFPYICLIPLLLGAGDAKLTMPSTWLQAFYEPVYIHAFIFFLCGSTMTVDITRRFGGLVAALHMAYFAVLSLLKPNKSEWLMLKMFARNIAIFGGYLLVAGGLLDSKKSWPLRVSFLQLGRQTQAAYAIFNGYLLWASQPDRAVHVSHLPFGGILVHALIILFILCGIMIYGGFQTAYFARLVAWLLLIVTVFIEFDMKYWRYCGITFWDQMHLAFQNICAIANLMIICRVRNW